MAVGLHHGVGHHLLQQALLSRCGIGLWVPVGKGAACGRQIEPPPGTLHCRLQAFTDRLHPRTGLGRPVAPQIFRCAVEHRTRRPQAQQHGEGEPQKYAKYMAVGLHHGVGHHLLQQALLSRCGIGLWMPVGKGVACGRQIALGQGIANGREMVAKLPEPQREVKNCHVPQQRQRPANGGQQQPIHAHGRQDGHQHGGAYGQPGRGGKNLLTFIDWGIQAAAHRDGPGF